MPRKLLFTLSSAILSVGLLAGCMEKPSSSAENPEEGASESGLVEITTVRTLKDDTKFKAGEDVNNNVVTKWSEEELGIKWNYLWTVPTDEQYNTKLRLSMSAGKDLPDVFNVSDANLTKDLIDSGLVQPIDEAIEKHATPRIKELFEQFPEAFYPTTVDGERYGLPRFSGGNGSDSLLWIRTDWLEEVGMEAPTTIDELEQVMDAFVNEDPDGNGKDDTIGITMAAKNGLATWLADASFVFGAHGESLPRTWVQKEDGSLGYGSIQPGVKEGLTKLRDWYSKGYLDQELAILSEQDAIESFVAGKSGIISAPPWAEGWPLADAIKNNPEATIQSYPLPSGPDGNIGRKGEVLTVGSFLFSKDFKDWDKFFEYWDAIYGYTFNDSEYFKNGLFENYDFVMQDGKPVYDHETIQEVTGEEVVDPGTYFLPTQVPTIPYVLYDILADFHETGREPKNAYEYKLWGKGEDYIRAGKIVNDQNEHRIENMFTGPPTETQVERGELLQKMEDETIADIIYGNKPVDAFDEFVAKWKDGGGDKITEEVNAWYESVK